jgi:hypothetical protein
VWAWVPHWSLLPGCWRACRVAFRACPTAAAGASGAGEARQRRARLPPPRIPGRLGDVLRPHPPGKEGW